MWQLLGLSVEIQENRRQRESAESAMGTAGGVAAQMLQIYHMNPALKQHPRLLSLHMLLELSLCYFVSSQQDQCICL